MNDPEMDAIQAIRDCIQFMNIPLSQHKSKIDAQLIIIKPKSSKYPFSTQVTFHNVNGSPYIEFDQTTFRGYGLLYQYYEPKYQDFSFATNGGKGHLHVTERKGNYEFELIFVK